MTVKRAVISRPAPLAGTAALLAGMLLLGCSDGGVGVADGTGNNPPGGSPGGGAGSGGLPPAGGGGGIGGPSGGGGSGGTPPTGGPSARACKNIDLVFSIDNSSSMREEQMVMGTTIFPAFAQKLRMISPTLESFRVGVLDACPKPASFHTRGRGGACDFSGGSPWISSTSPQLAQEFACVGEIDSTGTMCSGSNDDEQPVNTAIAALEPPVRDGANAGFLRRDAVLVVLAMTDEDEQPVPARSAQEVHDRLTAIKADPKMTVLLGIGGSRSCTGPYGGAKEARNLKTITDLFSARNRGVFWDLCAGSLEEGLGKAIAVIQTACQETPIIE